MDVININGFGCGAVVHFLAAFVAVMIPRRLN